MYKTTAKVTAALMTALLLMLTLIGCSAKEMAEEAPAYAPMDNAYGYESYDDYTVAEAADYGTALNESAEYETAATTAAAPEPEDSSSAIERKIIKDAYIEMEADDATACYSSILDYARQLGGYESSCQNRVDEYSSGRYVYINAELRLPPEKLEDFVSKTGEYGDVTYTNISQDEITEQYYDLTTRLTSKKAALDSYYSLLDKAETIEEILEIQVRIDGLTEEIESIKGKLRVYDSLVDESTVTISITEYVPTAPAEKEFEWDSLSGGDFLKLIKNGFLGVANFAWSLLQWIAIISISALPLLAIAAAVFFPIRAARRKRRNDRKKSEKANGSDNAGDLQTEGNK